MTKTTYQPNALQVFDDILIDEKERICKISFELYNMNYYLLLNMMRVSNLDDAWMSKGSFMQTKQLCVLFQILIKGEAGAVKPV